MQLFATEDYRLYLRNRLAALPSGGHGELLRIAKETGIHPSVLSQAFAGKRDLTVEQAAAVAEYFGLNAAETVRFLLLVQYARAGTNSLRKILKGQLEDGRQGHRELTRRVRPAGLLSPEDKAVFYSAWYYSAIRLLSAVPTLRTRESLRKRTGLAASKFRTVVEFLLSQGLCREENGKISSSPLSTHLEGGSPLVANHHANWRVKAMQRQPNLDLERELAFSCPMALSREAAQKIRAQLLESITHACAEADPSPSETVFCLNVDWFEI